MSRDTTGSMWEYHKAVDMTLLDWFATFAPEPTMVSIQAEMNKDKLANPHNNNQYKLRSNIEISTELRYKWAHEMMKARKKAYE